MRSMMFKADSESSFIMENLLHKGETLLLLVNDSDISSDACNKIIFEITSTIHSVYGKTVDIIDFSIPIDTYFKKGPDRIYESFLRSLINRDSSKEAVLIVDFEKLLATSFADVSSTTPIRVILDAVKSLGSSIIGYISSSTIKKLLNSIGDDAGRDFSYIVDTVITVSTDEDDIVGEYIQISPNFIPKHKKLIFQPKSI